MKDNRLFGLKYKYPKGFLEKLAKALGVKWTYVKAKTIPRDDVTVCPMPPPNNTLFYMEIKYNKPSSDNKL